MNRHRAAWGIAIFAVALSSRLLFLGHLDSSPYRDNLMIDSASYDRWAREIASGDFWGDRVFYQSPLYPYFLGGVYALFGPNLTAARAVQAVIGSLTCVLLALLTTRLFSPAAGVLAGLTAALYTTFVFQDLMILKSVVVLFFLALSLLFLSSDTDRRRGLSLATAGFFLGVAICGRGNLIFAAPLLFLWIVLRHRGSTPGRDGRVALLFLAGIAVALFPVTLRNRIVGGDWVLTESDAGINVYVGNNPEATGIHTPPFHIRTVPEHEEIDAARIAEKATGRSLKPSEVSRFWIDKALRFVLSDPVAEARIVGRKLRLLAGGYEVPDNYNQAYFARVSWLFRGTLPSFLWISPFALLGMVLSAPAWRRVGHLHAFVLAYGASLLALYVTSRYRLPIVAGLIPFAAFGATRFARMLRRRAWPASGLSFVLLAAVFLFGRASLFDYRGFAKQETEIATFLANRGDREGAEEAFNRAIEEGKGSGNLHLVYMNQGMFYLRSGDAGKAAAAFRNALRANPSFTPARLELEKLLRRESGPEERR